MSSQSSSENRAATPASPPSPAPPPRGPPSITKDAFVTVIDSKSAELREELLQVNSGDAERAYLEMAAQSAAPTLIVNISRAVEWAMLEQKIDKSLTAVVTNALIEKYGTRITQDFLPDSNPQPDNQFYPDPAASSTPLRWNPYAVRHINPDWHSCYTPPLRLAAPPPPPEGSHEGVVVNATFDAAAAAAAPGGNANATFDANGTFDVAAAPRAPRPDSNLPNSTYHFPNRLPLAAYSSAYSTDPEGDTFEFSGARWEGARGAKNPISINTEDGQLSPIPNIDGVERVALSPDPNSSSPTTASASQAQGSTAQQSPRAGATASEGAAAQGPSSQPNVPSFPIDSEDLPEPTPQNLPLPYANTIPADQEEQAPGFYRNVANFTRFKLKSSNFEAEVLKELSPGIRPLVNTLIANHLREQDKEAIMEVLRAFCGDSVRELMRKMILVKAKDTLLRLLGPEKIAQLTNVPIPPPNNPGVSVQTSLPGSDFIDPSVILSSLERIERLANRGQCGNVPPRPRGNAGNITM